MKKILGLDLGSGSIGWAVIHYSFIKDELSLLGLGSRPVPIDGAALSKFNAGQQVSLNASRTAKRTARKIVDRYIIRRTLLQAFFKEHGIEIPQSLMCADRKSLWKLRSDAVSRQLSPEELARVLYHINQKRGFKASKADLDPENKEQKGFMGDVSSRYDELRASGLTYGQKFYQLIVSDPEGRVKNQVYPRVAFIDEFDKIMEFQKQFYPELLSPENIKHLRNYIIFYQRPLKSCKHLVSPCQFEQRIATDADGRQITVGPKVAQRSNPLFQLSRIWQAVNNIVLTDRYNNREGLELHHKEALVKYLSENKTLTLTTFNKIVFGAARQNKWFTGDTLGRGIPGDKTRLAITKALDGKYPKLLIFEPKIVEKADPETGELLPVIDPAIVDSPYYRLWHCIYSIPDKDDLMTTLSKQFGITDPEVLENLSNIDFVKDGYGNMSVKAIRRILPFLMKGEMYSVACQSAGFRHSQSLTTDENAARQLETHLKQLKKGELRQPIVEKILNQMVNLVNALIDKYGPFDEIVVELARELQSSRDERYEATSRIKENERKNKVIEGKIEEFGLKPTRSRIIKYKLWEESEMRCIYCGNMVSIKEFLSGYDGEVEHIVPRSVLFDDSFSNKACACRKCNHEKGNMTARDYMETKGEAAFNEYVTRINALKDSKKISRTKFDHLMWTLGELPQDFIERQLRESQYISRKAMEMLRTVCRTVRATSGSVTDYLRHVWGWDQILHNLNLGRYRLSDLTEWTTSDQQQRERIIGWSKRLDHRHHAIDALTIACTSQGIIQQLNTLSSLKDKMFAPFLDQGADHKQKQSRLERYALSMPHFSVAEVTDMVASTLVSFKPATRLATPGKRYTHRGGKRITAQTGILVPRGGLHDETILGKITVPDKKKRGKLKDEFVVKYTLEGITTEKAANSIVDPHIRRLVIERLREFPKREKEAFVEPLYSDAAKTKRIRSVRCFTGYTRSIPVKFDADHNPIGYANPGGNYHVAIYKDADGNYTEHVATFHHCVQRRLHGIPAIIKKPKEVWDDILQRPDEFDETFLAQLPDVNSTFCMSMQRYEMFVMGMPEDEIREAIKSGDKKAICEHLYRVQKLSHNDYVFSRHVETDISKIEARSNKKDGRFIRISSLKALFALNPHKVKINLLGEIEEIC